MLERTQTQNRVEKTNKNRKPGRVNNKLNKQAYTHVYVLITKLLSIGAFKFQ